MEHDHGPRGLPASDRSLQGFFGGVRRCSERATHFYAEQGGESRSGELGGLKEMIARLETQSASYEGKTVPCRFGETYSRLPLASCVDLRLRTLKLPYSKYSL